MNTFIFNLLAKLINSDKIATYVRGVAGPVVTVVFLWLGAKVPFIAPYLTPELNAILVGMAVGLVTGLWGHIAKLISAPTPTEVAKVTDAMVKEEYITPTDAVQAKADPTLLEKAPVVGASGG